MIGRLVLGGAILVGAAAGLHAEEGNIFTNLFKYGGTTVPPSQPQELEEAYCPAVDIAEGGASLRIVAGDAVRTQITLGRKARECTRRADGSITVRVGIEARVLLGPAGSAGRFDVPVTVQIKHHDKVVTSRTERTGVTIAPGEAQGFASVVIEDVAVPAALSADYEIVASLGTQGKGGAKPEAPRAGRKKPAVATAPPPASGGSEAVPE